VTNIAFGAACSDPAIEAVRIDAFVLVAFAGYCVTKAGGVSEEVLYQSTQHDRASIEAAFGAQYPDDTAEERDRRVADGLTKATAHTKRFSSVIAEFASLLLQRRSIDGAEATAFIDARISAAPLPSWWRPADGASTKGSA
jgi:hypothetical protein